MRLFDRLFGSLPFPWDVALPALLWVAFCGVLGPRAAWGVIVLVTGTSSGKCMTIMHLTDSLPAVTSPPSKKGVLSLCTG